MNRRDWTMPASIAELERLSKVLGQEAMLAMQSGKESPDYVAAKEAYEDAVTPAWRALAEALTTSRSELADERLRTMLWSRGGLTPPVPWRWGFANGRLERVVSDGVWLVIWCPPAGRVSEPWSWTVARGRADRPAALGLSEDPLMCFRAAEAWLAKQQVAS